MGASTSVRKRGVPSAGGCYPLQWHLLCGEGFALPAGIYSCDPETGEFCARARPTSTAILPPERARVVIAALPRRTAARIVTGTLSGKTHVILIPIAKIGMRIHGLSPQLVVKGLGLVSRVLPSGSTEANAGEPQEGRDVKNPKTSLPLKVLTFLGDRASKKNQEHPSR